MKHESQLLPMTAQASLPEMPPASVFAATEAQGDFTGERLFQQRPDTYKAIVVLLAQRLGVIRIGKLLQVSPNTVMAVRDREQPAIDIVKDHLARVSHEGAMIAGESITAALAHRAPTAHLMSVRDIKDLAVTFGILVQNGQLLAGQPTARLEVNDLRLPDHDDFNAYIDSLPRATVTHLEGEKVGQKEAAVSPEPTTAEPAPGATTPDSDSRSIAPATQPTATQPTHPI